MPEPAAEKSIFLHAAGLDSPADRTAYLNEACGFDPAARARIEGLLAAHDRLGGDPPPTAGADSTAASPGPEAGAVLGGRFKLLEVIGEGGMGSVWLAEQTEPVRRLVALKVIKAGMDSKGVLARFEAERQALALMDHPNIAKVLDGGLTPDGRPFFVMELVKGVPITRYCDEHHLTPRQRLELFVPVCQAVQHAHQKGVIHRDLKPSNVLVAPYDGRPVPKVIDFGVAKAAGQPLTDKTLYTGLGAVVGTPEYMSPEQAELNNRDVDTRSDVYALGVLLYELLTGSTPFSKRDLKKAGMLEMLRVIREQEPSKPSTKLSAAAGLPTLAANRGTEPAKLTRLVRGELDWIVMKALEKDRNRRYETANGFAVDVQRYLADEPVAAGPPSAGYRLRKFARRHRVAVASTALVSAAVVFALVGLVVATVLISREKEQKAAAYEQARLNEETANAQRALADTRKELAEKNATEASEQRGIAQANERLAKANERLERRRLYASQTNLAMQAWRTGDAARALALLEGQRGTSPADDLRGFDWYYLWGLCQGGRRQFLRGHTSAISELVYSPDGRTLASAGSDRTVRLWDVETGTQKRALDGHRKAVGNVAYSPDGRLVAASGHQSDCLIVWDARTGRRLWTIPGPFWGLAFSPDSRQLAGGAVANNEPLLKPLNTRVWDAETGAEVAALDGGGPVIAFLPGGESLVTFANHGSFNAEVRVSNWRTGARRLTIPAHDGWRTAAVSRDGSRIAISFGFEVTIWDLATGKQVGTALQNASFVRQLDFSPDGKLLACACDHHAAAIWDLETRKVLYQDVHTQPCFVVEFSPDGRTLASASEGLIKLWEHSPPAEPATFDGRGRGDAMEGDYVAYLRFTPDGKTLFVADGSRMRYPSRDSYPTFRTQMVDVASGKWTATLPHSSAAFSADGTTAVTWIDKGEVAVREIKSGHTLARIKPGYTAPSSQSNTKPGFLMPRFALSPDGKRLAATAYAGDDDSVKLWDVSTGQLRWIRTEPPRVNRKWANALEFSPSGRLIAAGYFYSYFLVWDVQTGAVKLQQSVRGNSVEVVAVAFSPDDALLAVGATDGVVSIWEVATGRKVTECRGHTSLVQGLAFSPDSRVLATGSDDRSIRLWDAATGQERLTLAGHNAGVRRVQFSPNGRTLASSDWNGVVKLWRASAHPEARAFRRAVAAQDPFFEYVERLADDAVVLTIGPDPKERDPALALAKAEKALARRPQFGFAHLAHGLAHYRLGNWARAIEVLSPVAAKHPNLYGLVGPMLAMAHWQLGQRDEARTWFNDSKAYWNRNPDRGNAAYGLRVLAEAAELLGEPPVGK